MGSNVITAVDLIASVHKVSKSEAKRLLKSGAVSIAKDKNSELKKVDINQLFIIEENHE